MFNTLFISVENVNYFVNKQIHKFNTKFLDLRNLSSIYKFSNLAKKVLFPDYQFSTMKRTSNLEKRNKHLFV